MTWPSSSDVAEFVERLRDRDVTPHIAVDGRLSKTGKRRRTLIDRRTTRHSGYAASQRLRKRIEEGLRLDQDHRRAGQDPASRARPGGLDVHTHRRRIQPGPTAQTTGRGTNMMPASRRTHPPTPSPEDLELLTAPATTRTRQPIDRKWRVFQHPASPHYSRLAADLSEASGIGRVDGGFRGGFSLRVGD